VELGDKRKGHAMTKPVNEKVQTSTPLAEVVRDSYRTESVYGIRDHEAVEKGAKCGELAGNPYLEPHINEQECIDLVEAVKLGLEPQEREALKAKSKIFTDDFLNAIVGKDGKQLYNQRVERLRKLMDLVHGTLKKRKILVGGVEIRLFEICREIRALDPKGEIFSKELIDISKAVKKVPRKVLALRDAMIDEIMITLATHSTKSTLAELKTYQKKWGNEPAFIKAAGMTGSPEFIDHLNSIAKKVEKESYATGIETVFGSLAKMGDKGYDAIYPYLSSENIVVRLEAARQLMGSPRHKDESKEKYIADISDVDQLRPHSVMTRAIGIAKDKKVEEALPTLFQIVRSRNSEEMSSMAIGAITEIDSKGERSLDLLRRTLRETRGSRMGDLSSARSAVDALVKIGTAESLNIVSDAWVDNEVQGFVKEYISKKMPKIINAISEKSRKEDVSGYIHSLAITLRSENENVALSALDVLGRINTPEAVDVLGEAMLDTGIDYFVQAKIEDRLRVLKLAAQSGNK